MQTCCNAQGFYNSTGYQQQGQSEYYNTADYQTTEYQTTDYQYQQQEGTATTAQPVSTVVETCHTYGTSCCIVV